MKTKNTIILFLLTSLMSMQVIFAAAAAVAALPKPEHERMFPGLKFELGDPARGLDGSFFVEPTTEVMSDVPLDTELAKLYGYLEPLAKEGEERTDLKARIKDLERQAAESIRTRRGLVNIGGGSKGLVEIVALSYLETIINTEDNKESHNQKRQTLGLAPVDYIYISDLFDCGGGTSTGSIIVAGLFYNKDGLRYKAHEIAQLYVRCLGVIFGAGKKNCTVNIGAAKYDPAGLEGLLQTFFKGDATVSNAFAKKPVHIYAVNKERPDIIRFSPTSFEDVPLWQAVRASSSAPYYFPHMEFQSKGITYKATDGGTAINNPVADLVAERHVTEIYSFGAGTIDPNETVWEGYIWGATKWVASTTTAPLSRTEAAAALTTVLQTMEVTETEAIYSVLRSVNDPKHTMKFYAHLNPTIPAGTTMDFCDNATVHKMIDAAMCETETPVFKRMVEQLGFQMPDDESAENRRHLCAYGTLRLTTGLWHDTLRNIYTLHAAQVDETQGLRTDSQTNRGAVMVYSPSAATTQSEKRNALLLEYIKKGVNGPDGAKFLATVELPSDFITPDGWEEKKALITCLQSCQRELNTLDAGFDITEVLSRDDKAIRTLAGKFSAICKSCSVNNDQHKNLPLVAAVCAKYIMTKVDILSGPPAEVASPAAGLGTHSEAVFTGRGVARRIWQTITFSTPESRNNKFFEEINKIVQFLNTPSGMASPGSSRTDVAELDDTTGTPISPQGAAQPALAPPPAATAATDLPEGFQSMLNGPTTPEQIAAMITALQQKQAREGQQ